MSSKAEQLQTQIDTYKHQISLVQARMEEKTKEHDAMMRQVHNSKEYAAVLEKQLERNLEGMWDELIALGEKVESLGEELEKLDGEESK